jgi:dTDP-glucose pyrophosphorylase
MPLASAVVLARGLGRRMQQADPQADLSDEQRRAANAGLKAMMPIGGRPFLDFVLHTLADAGISRVALVVAQDHDAVRHYYSAINPPRRVTIDFVVQHHAAGTADALLAAEEWTAGGSFLSLNSDNLYPAESLGRLAALDEPGLTIFARDELIRTSNISDERIRSFALVETDESGYLKRIVEKPPAERATGPVMVSMNSWRFDSRIFDFCRNVPRSARGEFELPEAVGLALSSGVRFKAIPAAGPVLDLSRRSDAADVARRLASLAPRP